MVVNGKRFDFLHIVEDEEDHELDISLKSVEHHSYDESSLQTNTQTQVCRQIKV